jgi:hypothetical protein
LRGWPFISAQPSGSSRQTDTHKVVSMAQFSRPEITMINGKKKTVIPLASSHDPVPPNLRGERRESGYLLSAGTVELWNYQGFTLIGDKRCIYAEPLELTPFSDLFTLPAEQALDRLEQTAVLFLEAGIQSFIPEDALYFTEGGLLLLPPAVIDMLNAGKSAERLQETVERWVRPGFRGEGAAVCELTEFLYRIVTGTVPYEDEDTRDDSYRPVPAALLNPRVSGSGSSWMSSILCARKAEDLPSLAGWVEEFQKVRPDLLSASPPADLEQKRETYLRQRSRRARVKRLFRRKGTVIFAASAAFVVVAAILYSMVSRSLEPPPTAGLTPEEMIAFYYESQNMLDVQQMNACLDKGVKNERESLLTTLFVTSRTRYAYEQNDGLLPAAQWLEQGRPPTQPSTLIFGIVDLQIRQLDSSTFEADYRFFLPSGGSDEEQEGIIPVTVLAITEELSVRPEKDYWLITGIRKLREEAVESISPDLLPDGARAPAQ